MKNTLILFKSVAEEIPTEKIKRISEIFEKGSITFSTVEILSLSDNVGFNKALDRAKGTSDNLFVLRPKLLAFEIEPIIAEQTGIPFVEDDTARATLDSFIKAHRRSYRDELALIPLDSIFIPNTISPFNSFMLEDGDFTLVYLPDDTDRLRQMVGDFALKYFENKYNIKNDVFTVKYFGDQNKLFSTLKRLQDKCPLMEYTVDISYGDALVKLYFGGDVKKEQSDLIIREFMIDLSEGVYAEFDTDLGTRLFDLLKLRNMKISTAESFTAGRVISSVIKNEGASEVVQEGIVSYSNESKIKRLNVQYDSIKLVGAVSSKVAYEMALGLLKDKDTDIAISTTGCAGPTSEGDKPVGLYYIGIGMKDGIDVYKYRIDGDREEITETAKNTALFLAIKKIK